MSVGVLAGGGGREKRLAGREQMRGKGNKWWVASSSKPKVLM
jgi:hypothetical protein